MTVASNQVTLPLAGENAQTWVGSMGVNPIYLRCSSTLWSRSMGVHQHGHVWAKNGFQPKSDQHWAQKKLLATCTWRAGPMVAIGNVVGIKCSQIEHLP